MNAARQPIITYRGSTRSRSRPNVVNYELEALEQANNILCTNELEELTNIKGWAQWVSTDSGKSIGYAASVWHKDVMTGHRKNKTRHLIDPDHAIRMDMIIASMKFKDVRWPSVLIGIYVREVSLRELARVCHCDKGVIADLRDKALSYLMGRLENA